MSEQNDPEVQHSQGIVKVLPLVEVMERYAPGFPDLSWEQWLKEARDDSRVRALMSELSYREEKFFQVPIVLGYYPEEVDENGDVEDESYLIFDGMHRMAAYYFMGRDRGLFSLGQTPRVDSPEYSLEVSMTYENKPSEDDFDLMYDRASWRVGGDYSKPWISIESAFTAPDEMSMSFHSYSPVDALLLEMDTVRQDCWTRFAFLKPTTVGVKVTEYVPTEGEDFVEKVLGELPAAERRR